MTLNPGRFRSDEAQIQVLARTAGILGDLEAVIRRELGADKTSPKTGLPGNNRLGTFVRAEDSED
jgi:hypothetical protein